MQSFCPSLNLFVRERNIEHDWLRHRLFFHSDIVGTVNVKSAVNIIETGFLCQRRGNSFRKYPSFSLSARNHLTQIIENRIFSEDLALNKRLILPLIGKCSS